MGRAVLQAARDNDHNEHDDNRCTNDHINNGATDHHNIDKHHHFLKQFIFFIIVDFVVGSASVDLTFFSTSPHIGPDRCDGRPRRI